MPKGVTHALIWVPERDAYVLREPGRASARPLQNEGEQWFAWLASRSSFAFQGKHGHLTIQREARSRGEGYWYAYRSQNRRTFKRYVGRTADMTIAGLEATARALTSGASKTRPISHEHPETNDANLPRQLDHTAQGKKRRAVPRRRAANDTAAQSSKAKKELQEPVPTPTPAWQRQVPLLELKLHAPRLHASLISRGRLLAQLDAALAHKLTLLTAPAGYGKTTLVRQWVAKREAAALACPHFPPLAWVSLDTGDNDPVRFLSYVITACQAFQAGIGQSALAILYTSLQPPFEPLPLEAVLTTLLNELAHCSHGGILILEDYHVITSPQVHETMTFVLDHLPPSLHLIIVTRSDPALPLARLRASNDLREHESSQTVLLSGRDCASVALGSPLSGTVLGLQRPGGRGGDTADSYFESYAGLLMANTRSSAGK